MAELTDPLPQPAPSIEPRTPDAPVESIELIEAEIANRALTTTTVLQDILARGDDRRYSTHWGINE